MGFRSACGPVAAFAFLWQGVCQHFGGIYCLRFQGEDNRYTNRCENFRVLFTTCVLAILQVTWCGKTDTWWLWEIRLPTVPIKCVSAYWKILNIVCSLGLNARGPPHVQNVAVSCHSAGPIIPPSCLCPGPHGVKVTTSDFLHVVLWTGGWSVAALHGYLGAIPS
jgi:hypothetical protein